MYTKKISSKPLIPPAARRAIEAQIIQLFFRFSSAIVSMAFGQGKLSEKAFLFISIPLGSLGSLYYLYVNIRRAKASGETISTLSEAKKTNIKKREALEKLGEDCGAIPRADIVIESKSILEKNLVITLFVFIEISNSVGHAIIPLLYRRNYIRTPTYAALLLGNMLLGTILFFVLGYDREKSIENARNNTKFARERKELEELGEALLKRLYAENIKLREENTKKDQNVSSKQTDGEGEESSLKRPEDKIETNISTNMSTSTISPAIPVVLQDMEK